MPLRRSARLLLLDPRDRVLLLRAHDPADAAFGEWLELPGGGVEDGESAAEAACREVREETGYVVPATAVGPVQWRAEVTFTWLGRRHRTAQEVLVGRLVVDPARVPVARSVEEDESFSAVLWLPLVELAGHRLFPDLPDLDRILAGERIEAGSLRWS